MGTLKDPVGYTAVSSHELWPRSRTIGFLFFAFGNEGHALFLGELDLKLISRDKIQQSGVSLTNQQVAVALHNSFVGELTAAFANAAARTNANALGFEQCLVKSGEVESVRTIFLLRDIAIPSLRK